MALPFSWSRYLATVPQEDLDTNGTEGQAALKWVQQYDPNAQYSSGFAASGQPGSFLQYDNSKLPQNITGGRGIENIARGTAGSGERLANPNAVGQDPVYGAVTSWRNLQEKGPSMVDILGPLVVGGAIGLGGGFSMFNSLFSKLPGLGQAASSFFQQPQQMSPQQLALLQIIARQRAGGGG